MAVLPLDSACFAMLFDATVYNCPVGQREAWILHFLAAAPCADPGEHQLQVALSSCC